MGTNYYALLDACSECGQAKGERFHLAKISAGWYPLIELHEDRYSNWTEFKELVRKDSVLIENEYGDKIDAETLISKIEQRYEDDQDYRSHTKKSDVDLPDIVTWGSYQQNHPKIEGIEFSKRGFE